MANRRAKALLGYLAMAPENKASRMRLRGLLWSDRGEDQARASLRQCILATRNALEAAELPLMDATNDSVWLEPGAFETDLDVLRSALARGDVGQAVRSLEACGESQLLEGLEIPGLYRDWLDQTRSRLDQLIASETLALLTKLESAGDWRAVQALALAYLARDALDESIAPFAVRAEPEVVRPPARPPRGAAVDEVDEAPGAEPFVPRKPLGVDQLAPAQILVTVAGESWENGRQNLELSARLIRDEIISALVLFREFRLLTDARPLNVISAEPPEDDSAAAYAVGVSVTGGPAGDRVVVQLVRRGERHVVWSRRFHLVPDDPHAVEEAIAMTAAAVLPSIQADLVAEARDLPAEHTYNRFLLTIGPDAYPPHHEAALRAVTALESMIAANPNFTAAYLPLAFLYNTDFGGTRAASSGPAEHQRALDLAKRALSLDRGNPHAYTASGWAYLRRRQWDLAVAHFDQALALNPYHVRRKMEVGYGLIFLGEFERARALLDRCMQLTPAPRDGFFTDLGLLSMLEGDYASADRYYHLAAEPEIWCCIFTLINSVLDGRAHGAERTAALQKIQAVWDPAKPLDADHIVAWLEQHHPFRDAQIQARFSDAARKGFTPS